MQKNIATNFSLFRMAQGINSARRMHILPSPVSRRRTRRHRRRGLSPICAAKIGKEDE